MPNSLYKKLTKDTLRQVFYLSKVPSPPPLNTVYLYTVYLFTQGGGGRGVRANQRED
jgi:hypothetical protein